MTHSEILQKIELIATNIIVNDFSSKLIFHNIKHIKRVVKATQTIGKKENLSDEDIEVLQMGVWLNFIGLSDLENFQEMKNPPALFLQCLDMTIKMIEDIFDENQFPEQLKSQLISLIQTGIPIYEEKRSLLEKVFIDALTSEWATKKGSQRIKLLYEQMLLIDVIKVGTKGWYELVLGYLKELNYQTEYGKKVMMPIKEKNYFKLQKEYKDLKKQKDFALQKELNISEVELKELKKKLKASTGRDDRGIQTMLRTSSKNHYTLNEMVDKKASIMISVNSIILSVIIGGMINVTDVESIGTIIPIFIMVLTGFSSIIFAVIAIRPSKTHGRFTREEINTHKGNLLYFGNFHDMEIKDYEWGIFQMLSNQQYLYSTMIRDLYYLGKTLNKKYKAIRISLTIFVIGIASASISFFIFRFCWFCF